MLSDRYICGASDHINKVIKESITLIPQEIADLQSKKEETEASIQKLMNFIMAHGNTSKAVKESLDAKEVELAYLKERINSGWFIQGELAMSLEYGLNGKAKSKPVEEKPSSLGFSQLIGGGEGEIRTLGAVACTDP